MVNKKDLASTIEQIFTTIDELGIPSIALDIASNSTRILNGLKKLTDYIETHKIISIYYSLGSLHPNLSNSIRSLSGSEKISICYDVRQKDIDEKIKDIHINLIDIPADLDISESLYSNIVYVLSICHFYEKGIVPLTKAKICINEALSEEGIDLLNENDDKTTRFLRAYSRTFLSENPTELETDVNLIEKEITADKKEEAFDIFKSKFWTQDTSDKRHKEIMDELDEKKLIRYLKRLLDSEVNTNALFKRIIGMSLNEFEKEIQDSYSTYIVLSRGFLDDGGGKRQRFMEKFDNSFATGGSTGYKIRDETINYNNGEKMNYIVVSETNLSRTRVESELHKQLPSVNSDEWDKNEHYAYILSCDLGEITPLMEEDTGRKFQTIQSWENLVDQSQDISKDLLAETLEDYLSLDELLAVVPLCFFKDDCPKDVEKAFFSRHYEICSKTSINCIDDWTNANSEEIYEILAEDLETTPEDIAQEQIQEMINEVSAYVDEKETRIS